MLCCYATSTFPLYNDRDHFQPRHVAKGHIMQTYNQTHFILINRIRVCHLLTQYFPASVLVHLARLKLS